MKGMVKAVDNANFTFECVFFHQLVYDSVYSAFDPHGQGPPGCSGVLAAMPNGTVIHGRNEDWGHDFGTVAAGNIEVTYWKGGKPLFMAESNLALFGAQTAMALYPGGFSFEQNTRPYGLDPDRDLALAEAGGVQSFHFARELFEQKASYAEAVAALASTRMNAPQYFVLAGAGPYEGAVITVDPTLDFNNVEVLNKDNRHMLYQLNKDAWVPQDEDRDGPPLKFMWQMEQREQGVASNILMDVQGAPKDVDVDSVWELMTGTALYTQSNMRTFLAVPGTGYHRIMLHPEGTLEEFRNREGIFDVPESEAVAEPVKAHEPSFAADSSVLFRAGKLSFLKSV